MSKRRIALFAATVAALSVAVAGLVLLHPPAVASGADTPPGDGVTLKILDATVPADLKPVVTFTVTDAKGNPLKLTDIDNGGLRFLIASLQTDPETKSTRYVNYVVNSVQGKNYVSEGQTTKPVLTETTQASVDSGGTFAELGGGKFTYTFKTVLPSDFDRTATHTVGGYATRNNRAFVSNDAFDFIPAGGTFELRREVVKTEGCNACHDQLAAHGGTRRDTRLCALCHTPQTTDPETGNSVDFKVMVHKIHSGANLPSVKAGDPYVIVGYQQSKFDFSGIRWPQDTRNCQTCHTGAQGANYKTKPSAEACSSCHDKVNFKTGENHPGGPQTNANCALCHQAEGPEFGPSVAGAHTIPERSKQLRGVNFQIVSFTNTKQGQSPTVVFNVKDNAGQTIAPAEMARLALTLAGPTIDYANMVQETATTATQTGDGNFSYTFKAKIPDNAQGTYAVGIEGYLEAGLKDPSGNPVKDGAGKPLVVRDVGFNQVAYGAVTDDRPMPRKTIVDINSCNSCHETLALHGGIRRNAEYCLLCHNPNNSDAVKRAQAKGPTPPESINFVRLIHRIHTGEEQSDKPYVIYGGSPANPGPINLSEARFPTDRRNCTKCHVPNSNLLAFMRPGVQPTTVKVGDTIVSSTPAIQTACISCHDNSSAKAHAETTTAPGGRESCLVCHNEGREFAVSKAHAR